MKRWPRRSTPAIVTGVVALAVCALVTIEAIQLLTGNAPLVSYQAVAERLHATHWNDPVPAIAGGVVAVLGLMLFLAAILPGKPTVLPLTEPEGVDAGVARGDLRATLRRAARSADGVSSASLSLRRKKVAVRVKTDRVVTEGLADAVRAKVEEKLDRIRLARKPEVKVTVRSSRSRT